MPAIKCKIGKPIIAARSTEHVGMCAEACTLFQIRGVSSSRSQKGRKTSLQKTAGNCTVPGATDAADEASGASKPQRGNLGGCMPGSSRARFFSRGSNARRVRSSRQGSINGRGSVNSRNSGHLSNNLLPYSTVLEPCTLAVPCDEDAQKPANVCVRYFQRHATATEGLEKPEFSTHIDLDLSLARHPAWHAWPPCGSISPGG